MEFASDAGTLAHSLFEADIHLSRQAQYSKP